jgi:branched-chain amino acid transport system permease protein
VDLGGLRVPLLQLVIVTITILMLCALVMFLRFTSYGLQMRAAADDFVVARYLGVRADKVIALAFGISGLLAGVISLVLVTQAGVLSPTMGVNMLLFGFISTVIGGMGSLVGAVTGGMLIGVVSSFLHAICHSQ